MLKEFFSKCPDFIAPSHPFDIRLIDAAQLIRTFTSSAVLITSTFRTPECNIKSGGKPNSYHLSGRAIDLCCPGINLKVKDQIISKGELYQSLRRLGINGFGFADTFIHLDVRLSGSLYDSKFGFYDLWHY